MTSATLNSVDQLSVNTIRFLSVDGVERAKSGHPGTPMEAAPLAYVLFTRLLKHNPKDPLWINRDRFVLSCGHASMLLYSVLHLSGYGLSLEEVKNFRQWGSKTPGHPEHGLTAGVETTTGPLGQGFATGVGMAMAERHLAARFNRPGHDVIDYFTWAFVSDGDLMEGVASEAASLAGHLKLGRLKYVYLDNRITIEGGTDLAFSEDVAKRFESYGWQVLRLDDANDLEAVEKSFALARSQTERPTLVIVRTHIGFGAPKKQDTAEAHGAPLGAEETAGAKAALGWTAEQPFHVPEEVSAHFQREAEKGAAAQAAWNDALAAWRKAHPDLSAQWDAFFSGALPADWAAKLPAFKAGDGLATRQASGKVINALAPVLPQLIGGSADLAPSTNTLMEKDAHYQAGSYGGRNLHFGIREHAMGSILNGFAVTAPFLPYGATFLTFTDYMKPAIRLAALMDLGVIYVMTHDSIGLGEDGPTHQPIEHLAALRAIPNVVVLRPADAAETAWAWRLAVERRKGPTVIVLSRQKLPVLDRAKFAGAEGVAKGAYVLSHASQRKPQVILMGTGAEVHVALEAQVKLEEKGIPTRVVSMPSWELFEAQPASYKEDVLPAVVRTRVAVEAGCSLGWHRYTGLQGALVTLDRFGASAPAEILFEKFGFTADNVAAKALAVLSR
jgi:transketolase